MRRTARPLARAALLLALAAATVAAPAHAASVEVSVTNVLTDKGRVHVELCPEALFLKDCTLFGEAPARIGTTIVTVRDVPPGTYAVQAYHDENGNGKVDRGLFGIPREGVGFSNDAPLRRKGPRFEDARFPVARPVERITLRLRHFL